MNNQQHIPEPFGYFKAEPFGWAGCADTDDDAIPLYDKVTIRLIQKQLDEALEAKSQYQALLADMTERCHAAEQQREELLAALKRAEIVVDIASDWMTEIEMPVDGWVPVSSELNRIRKTVAEIDRKAARDDSQKQGY